MKEQIARSVFWMVWSKGGVQVLSFFSTLAIARWLDPSDYGVMALVGIWTGTIGMMAELGLGGAIVQFKDVTDEELNVCFWLTVLTTGTAYLALFLAAPYIAAWFESPRVSTALRVASLSLLIWSFRLVPDSLLRKRLGLDRIAQAEIGTAILTIPLMLVLAWRGQGVWALVAGSLAQAVLQTSFILWANPWWPGWRLDARRIGRILRYSGSLLGANLGWSAFSHVDTVIVGKLTGEQTLGFYSMAKHLATLPVTKISVVVNQLMFPVLAQWQDNHARLRTAFFKVLRLVSCATVPLTLGMVFLAEDFVELVLSAKWQPIVPVFQVFCLYALIHSIEVLMPPVLMARYRAGFLFWWTVALLVGMPLPFILGAMTRGAVGVAVTWVLVYPLFMAVMARTVFSELSITVREAWGAIRPVLMASLVMAGAVALLLVLLPSGTMAERVVRLVLAPLAGIATYGIALLWRGGLLSRDIQELVGWIIGRRRMVPVAE